MSPTPNKKPSERDALICELEEQVKHAEEHGQFDTAHHQMLRQLKGEQKPVKEE